MAAELQKVTLNLFAGDFAKLQDLYPVAGAGKIVRNLVRQHLKGIEARVAREVGDTDDLDSI